MAQQPDKRCKSLPAAVPPARVRGLLLLVEEYNEEAGRLSFVLRGLAPLVAQVADVPGISPLTREIAGYIAPDGERVLDELIVSVEQHGINPGAAIERTSARCRLKLATVAHLAGQLLERDELPPAADPPVRLVWGAALAQQHKGNPLEPLALDLTAVRTALYAAFTPPATGVRDPAPPADGPYGGRWCVVAGVRYDVPGGVLYRLLEHFWTRDHATYQSLYDTVFDGEVEPQTVRSKSSALKPVLERIGVPWRLKAKSDPLQPGGGHVTRYTPDA